MVDRRPIVAVTGLKAEARIAAGAGVRTIAAGADADLLADALAQEFASGARAIISFGIAGGLAPSARAGSWLVAENVVTHAARWPVDRAWAAALAEHNETVSFIPIHS